MKLYEKINARNWIQTSTRRAGKRCIMGHLWEVYPELGRDALYAALDSAATVLFPERVTGDCYRATVNFNDHPATTVDDVIRVCKVADV